MKRREKDDGGGRERKKKKGKGVGGCYREKLRFGWRVADGKKTQSISSKLSRLGQRSTQSRALLQYDSFFLLFFSGAGSGNGYSTDK